MKQPLKQVAALPFVETEQGPLVLLITTRGRGLWSIPKGWPKQGMADPELAAREAFEEAGVEGDIVRKPVGTYDYTKRLHVFSWTKCSVEVYALKVHCQCLEWPEKQARQVRWTTPEEAASLVKEAQLAGVLRGFANQDWLGAA